MAKYMTEKNIQDVLQEGLEEKGSIAKSFDYLLEHSINDIFEMDDWDVPKFTETEIKFNGVIYKINIESNGCCEFTNSHRIMYWNWQVEPVKKQ